METSRSVCNDLQKFIKHLQKMDGVFHTVSASRPRARRSPPLEESRGARFASISVIGGEQGFQFSVFSVVNKSRLRWALPRVRSGDWWGWLVTGLAESCQDNIFVLTRNQLSPGAGAGNQA